ncbi:hypothetical protein E4Z66_08370 [Aliishimia ponticola]|uniref:Uncharacterized protein n=1 Tax=Aliishimia ponticola TaxID=2499833 RepID=A0A4S4NC06_9RHOB|nr:hypothetical protein [Aliishimia ponticola]THH36946.1 hypothetical protein E4Z66_08370 [Aliishimia ponticola]
MAEEQSPPASTPTPLGIYDRSRDGGLAASELIAIGLSILWLIGVALFFLVLPSTGPETANTGLRAVLVGIAVLMPVGMIWIAATAARASRVMREESQRLQAAIDAIRQAYIAQNQSGGMGADTSITRKLDEIAVAARKTEITLATFTSTRHDANAAKPIDAVAEPAPVDDQPTLELGTPPEVFAPPLATEDFLRALNFPETAEDEEGFAALRRALRDREAGQLIQAAQDVLTLLSQEGIYMDDLSPDRARPEIWRHFAQGQRGKPVAGLGGIHDRSSLALSAARMKQDPIFRDAAHHFLRKFDHTFAAWEPQATDQEIAALTDTRTARAFMLLGRVTGTFD